MSDTEWWRDAVFYQVYVRSFADSNGDGVGDLPGITGKLDYLHGLGVDAHLADTVLSIAAGRPRLRRRRLRRRRAALRDARRLRRPDRGGARARHPRDRRHRPEPLVVRAPLVHGPDREQRYVTVTGGDLPNNWPSNWGGPAWTYDEERGHWYLHLFAPEQPDLDWNLQLVRDDFEQVLRFWLDRGVDGFRIDVAHGLVKKASLEDEPEPFPENRFSSDWRTAVDQPEVHDIYRDWHRLTDEYDGDRMLVGEVVFSDQRRVAPYLRADELHLAFNFSLVFQPWEPAAIRASIDESLRELPIVDVGVREPRRDADRHPVRR